MIPKPNKPLSLENLRPISLTSCAGKLFEHMVHDRITQYLEDNGHLPDTMFGFRQHLSTQDVLLQLKEGLLDHLNNRSKYSIVAVDVKGAFDNVSHDAILTNLEDTGCGARTYAYVRNFLMDRTATVGICNIRSESFLLPNRGTPQGSVISPLLFNVAMIKLPHSSRPYQICVTRCMLMTSRSGPELRTLEGKKVAYKKPSTPSKAISATAVSAAPQRSLSTSS